MKKILGMMGYAALLLCACALGACSDEVEKKADTREGTAAVKKSAQRAQVKSRSGAMRMEENKKTGTVKMTTEAGEKISTNTAGEKLVEGFPKDIPIYADARISMSQLMEDKHAVATLTTADEPAQVVEYYKAMLADSGWTFKDPMTMGNFIMLRGTKDDRILSVQITREGEQTSITLGMAAE